MIEFTGARTATFQHVEGGIKYYGGNRQLNERLKTLVPKSKKRPVFINDRFSHWLFSPDQQSLIERMCDSENCQAKFIGTPTIQGKQTKILKILYVGRFKDRKDGSLSACGLVDGEWNFVLPESVAKQWFLVGDEKEAALNEVSLYSILNVKKDVDGQQLKKAFRIAARRWHPDMNDEDTSRQFMRVKEAYDLLSNPLTRKKYNAALMLQQKMDTGKQDFNYSSFSLPVKCGLIMFSGENILGRWVANKILSWQDIVNIHGQTLVTSYKKDRFTNEFELVEEWV